MWLLAQELSITWAKTANKLCFMQFVCFIVLYSSICVVKVSKFVTMLLGHVILYFQVVSRNILYFTFFSNFWFYLQYLDASILFGLLQISHHISCFITLMYITWFHVGRLVQIKKMIFIGYCLAFYSSICSWIRFNKYMS